MAFDNQYIEKQVDVVISANPDLEEMIIKQTNNFMQAKNKSNIAHIVRRLNHAKLKLVVLLTIPDMNLLTLDKTSYKTLTENLKEYIESGETSKTNIAAYFVAIDLAIIASMEVAGYFAKDTKAADFLERFVIFITITRLKKLKHRIDSRLIIPNAAEFISNKSPSSVNFKYNFTGVMTSDTIKKHMIATMRDFVSLLFIEQSKNITEDIGVLESYQAVSSIGYFGLSYANNHLKSAYDATKIQTHASFMSVISKKLMVNALSGLLIKNKLNGLGFLINIGYNVFYDRIWNLSTVLLRIIYNNNRGISEPIYDKLPD